MEHEVGWRNEGGAWSAWTRQLWLGRAWTVSGTGDGPVASRPGVLAASALTVDLLGAAFAAADGSPGATAALVVAAAWPAGSMWSARRQLRALLATEGPPPPGDGTKGWSRAPGR